jgi:beta-N-acetylhexosaminidase
MMQTMSARGIVMLDVSAATLQADDMRRLHHPLTGGVVLFSRNFESRRQLAELVDAIRDCCPRALIAIDHEGGRAQQFKSDGFTALPAMRALGELWMDDALQATRLATDIGFVLAAELRACGLDLSFSPVLDLDHGVCPAIGDRAFHRDPRVVTLLAKSVSHGMALAGMANCGKHFPGHGYVDVDSHGGIPVDQRELDDILADDAAPFGWLGLSLASVMPAYVLYPKVDTLAAGFSRKWLTTILRGQLGFQGAIFAEDLSMEGARVMGDIIEGAHAALDAGCDMLVLCGRPDLADRLLAELKVEQGPVLEQSRRRIELLKPASPAMSWNALQEDARYRAARENIHTFLEH